MRHLSIPVVLVAGCLSAGGAWAQSVPVTGGLGASTNSSAGSVMSTDTVPGVTQDSIATQGLLGESGSLSERGLEGSTGSVASEGLQDLTGGADESPGDVDLGPARDVLTRTTPASPGTEGTFVDSTLTEPDATGTLSGDAIDVDPLIQEEQFGQGICRGCSTGQP